MKIKKTYLYLLLFCFANGHSQDIKKLLGKAFTSQDSSDYYFKIAKKNIKTPAEEADYYFCKNARTNDYNQLDSSLVYGNIAIQKLKKIGNTNTLYYVYNNIAKTYRTKGEYEKAIKYLLEGLKIAETENKEYWIVNYNINIGLNYHDFESFKNGIFYAKKAYKLALNSQKKDANSIVFALNTIAINFDDWNKPDSAIYYHKKVFNYMKGKDTLKICNTYNNIGNTLLKQKKYAEAQKWINRAVKINNFNVKIKDKNYYYELATQHTNLATIAYELDDYKKAEILFEKSFLYAKQSGSAEKMRDYYHQNYLFNKKRNNLEKTIESQEGYIKLRDSVFKTERATTFATLEAKYQNEKKEKQLLKNEIETKEKNELILILSIIAIGLAAIGFLIYRHQKLKNKQQNQEFEYKTAIATIENKSKLQDQRLSISRDLHDNIGSQLTFIISSVDNVKLAFDLKDKKIDAKLNNISSFAKETIVELRDTIWAMNSNQIRFEDLKIRILNFIEKAKIAKEGIDFQFSIDEKLSKQNLTSIEGMNIYRTIQEAVNNAIKYANPTKILITVEQIDAEIQIAIHDNGTGFDPNTVEKGNGLQNMEKRIEDIGGKFHITSKINEGTNVFAFLNYL